MALGIDKNGQIVVPKPLRTEQRPSMVKVDGLWVHQGSAEPGASWERVLEDVREERIGSILKA